MGRSKAEDSGARYRAQKHVPYQALPDATHGHLVSQAPILGAHTKTALSSPKWGENRRFFCVLGASGASALVVGCWPPRWAGVCCDVLTRASEHDTLHHCRAAKVAPGGAVLRRAGAGWHCFRTPARDER